MSSIYHNLHTERQYKVATALSQSQLETLFAVFDKLYIRKTVDFLSGNQKAPVLTDKREALFFILHYYKAYPSLENMALYFGFSQATAIEYKRLNNIGRLSAALKACLQAQQPLQTCVFKTQQAFEQAFAGVDELLIDVTQIPVEPPVATGKQQRLYTGKKSPHPQVALTN